MTDQPITIADAALPLVFRAAERQAERIPDISSYDRWQTTQELRYDGRMPDWFRDVTARKRAYIDYVKRALDWRKQQGVVDAEADIFEKVAGR